MGGDASAAAEAEDLERGAVDAHLAGDEEASLRGFERAHQAYVAAGTPDRAARCAAWVALGSFFRGDVAHAGGWLARAERLLDHVAGDCAARGFLLLPTYMETLGRGDIATAHTLATDMTDIGRRCGDADLVAFGVLCLGESLLARGEPAGMKLLDEVMVSVTTGELSPLCAGIVYCAVIDKCMDRLDLRRAAEWTTAFERWCAARPELVPYRGQCLVHRSQVLQAHGSWNDAVVAAEEARRRLTDPPHPAVGMALYQLAELHRLRGEFAEAERAYRAAGEHGREPTPGFALLRLAEGNAAAAAAAISRMLDEAGSRANPATLAAAVEIFLASGDVERARAAAGQLAAAATSEAPALVLAIAAYASGCVALADGDASAALVSLRRACAGWHDLGMPYEVARARATIALACRALGDLDAVDLELDSARIVFERLAARPDLARLATVHAAPASAGRADGLTERECDVLRLVAAGKTNREVADALVISQHTVARHLQNTFVKLGVSSRAAATAYAYEHGIV